ncbi:MAG TPA: DUF2231 domain-containing protein [Sphingomonadaceae bacterium]
MARHFLPTVTLFRVPVHAKLVPIPIVCFIGALLTDITYANTAVMQWANFSAWLLAFGEIFGVIAAIFGLIDFLNAGAARPMIGWIHLVGNAIVLVLEGFNNFVHARDAYTSVVPTGLVLSIISVAILAVTGMLGWRMVYVHVAGDRP